MDDHEHTDELDNSEALLDDSMFDEVESHDEEDGDLNPIDEDEILEEEEEILDELDILEKEEEDEDGFDFYGEEDEF